MLKKTITYKDFNGVSRTEDFYFNLTEFEATEFSVSLPDNIVKRLSSEEDKAVEKIAEEFSKKELVDFIKELVVRSYGVKTADGKGFEKSERITKDFTNTNAFSQFMMDLLRNDVAASDFINGVIPADFASKIKTNNTLEN